MIFEQLNDGIPCRTYLIASGGEALLVDPVLDCIDRYLARCAELGLTLRYTVDTHTHADHLSGSKELVRRSGAKSMGRPRGVAEQLLEDGDEIALGDLRLRVWATPGHTADSIVLLLPDRLITADTLLVGATGRTDLPTGDAEREFESLQRLLTLPDELLVFPGHVYGDKPDSTLGEERRTNPRLSLSREEFVKLMTQPRPDKPELLEKALAYNSSAA
jgi:sulfur dioxygenase